jgi:hypothetical protein
MELLPDGQHRRRSCSCIRSHARGAREDAVRLSQGPDAREPMGFKQDEYLRWPP